MQRTTFTTAVLVGLALIPGAAQGAPIFFTDEASFQSAVSAAGGTPSVESFEGVASGTEDPFTTANGITVTDPAPDSGLVVIIGNAAATDGSQVIRTGSGAGDDLVSFAFASPINFFGIDVIDLGTGGATDLTLTTDTGSQLLLDDFTGVPGNVQFVGVIDTESAFSNVTINNTTAGDVVFFDRLQFGTTDAAATPVPEPASLAIWGVLGLGAAGARLRRRQNRP